MVSASPLRVCPERLRLNDLFSETTRIYAELVVELRDRVRSGLESEVTLMRPQCRTAWENVERSRLAVFRHEVDHSCHLPARPLYKAAGA